MKRFWFVALLIGMLIFLPMSASAVSCQCVQADPVLVNTVAATCTKDGYFAYECRDCGMGWNETNPNDLSSGHIWDWDSGSWINGAPANCLEVGLKSYPCYYCSETTVSEEYGHCQVGGWEWLRGEPADCTEYRPRVKRCKHCGEEWEWGEAAGSHHYVTQTIVAATCGEGGLDAEVCTICGGWFNNGVQTPSLGHSWGPDQVDHPGDCQLPGLMSHMCTRCRTREEWETGYGDHRWGAWQADKAATCTEGSTEKRTCSVCQKTESRTNNSLGHDMGEWYRNGVPTCTTTGVHRRNCTRCDYYETKPIPTVDHVFGEWYVVTEPQVGLPGLEQRDCTYGCGTHEQREIPALEKPISLPGLELTLELSSTPANGEYFVVGEEVTFTEHWINNSTETLYPFYVSIWTYPEPVYPYGDAPEYMCSWDAEDTGPVAPGASGSHTHTLTVTETDVARGGIHAMAIIISSVHNGVPVEDVTTSFVTAPCAPGAKKADLDGLTVTKSAPRGSHSNYYYPGEEVPFTIVVTNNTGVELVNLVITDPIVGGDGVVGSAPSLQPGESVTVTFSYTTTEADALIGTESFQNTAYAAGYTQDGTQVNGTSNTVNVWCVIPHAIGISKYVAGTPANGEFFVPGEVIEFIIELTNDTPYPLYTVTLTDPLCEDQYVYDEFNDMSYLFFGELYREGNPMGYSDSATVTVTYVVTEADAEAGAVTNTAEVEYMTWYGEVLTASASATAPCGKAGKAVTLEKIDMRGPANGEYYVVGESIKYGLTVRSTEDNPLQSIRIYDPLKVGDPLVFGPADSWVLGVEFDYVVTEADAQRGFITNTGYATFTYQNTGKEDLVYSNALTLPCGFPEDLGLSGALSFTKAADGTPANGAYFVPGENIRYTFTLTNTGTVPLVNLSCVDTMIGSGYWDQLAVGETITWDSSYQVTELDAMAGSVDNIAYVNAFDADSNQYVEYSNTVTVPCGFPDNDGDGQPEDPFGVLTGLEITKEVESLPLNGKFYEEGETIAYRITYVNTGETVLTDVMIYDALAGFDEIASAEMLQPGESRACYVHYTVTGADVTAGSVSNTAIGMYTVGSYVTTIFSNTVKVSTNSLTNMYYITGTPDHSGAPDQPGTIDAGQHRSGKSCCVRTITGKDNASASYETRFCADHAATQSSVLIMNQAAATPETRLQAATYAVTLWRTKAEQLYQEILAVSDHQAKATVMTEYVRFLTDAANYEAVLKVLYPDQPALVAQKVAGMWEEHCVTMCCEMHTAPQERKDSLLHVAASSGAAATACACTTVSEASGTRACTHSYCALHAFPFSMTDALTNGQDTAAAWDMVRQIWNVELTGCYNRIAAKMGADNGLATTEYAFWTQWMTAREAFLTALYPDNPELVAQTMVKTIMDRVNDLCQAVN